MENTKGTWNINSKTLYKGLENIIDEHGQFIALIENRKTLDETIANASLIAEAGTIANECGCTPKQLLKQRNKLFDACSLLINSIPDDKSLFTDDQQTAFNLIEKAINNILQ